MYISNDVCNCSASFLEVLLFLTTSTALAITTQIIGFFISGYLKLTGNVIIVTLFAGLRLFFMPITVRLLMNGLQEQHPKLQVNQIKRDNTNAIIVLSGDDDVTLKEQPIVNRL